MPGIVFPFQQSPRLAPLLQDGEYEGLYSLCLVQSLHLLLLRQILFSLTIAALAIERILL